MDTCTHTFDGCVGGDELKDETSQFFTVLLTIGKL